MKFNYNKISKYLLKKFEEIVGSNSCFSEFETRWTYAFGGTIFQREWIFGMPFEESLMLNLKRLCMVDGIQKGDDYDGIGKSIFYSVNAHQIVVVFR